MVGTVHELVSDTILLLIIIVFLSHSFCNACWKVIVVVCMKVILKLSFCVDSCSLKLNIPG